VVEKGKVTLPVPQKPEKKEEKKEKKEKPKWLEYPITLNAQLVPYDEVVSLVSVSCGVPIYVDRKITTPISVMFDSLPLERVLDILTEPYGFRYEVGEDYVKIITFETKIFRISLPPSMRKVSTSLNTALVNIESSSEENEGQSSQKNETTSSTGQLTIQNQLDVDTWKQIESTIKQIIEGEEKMSVKISYSVEETTTRQHLGKAKKEAKGEGTSLGSSSRVSEKGFKKEKNQSKSAKHIHREGFIPFVSTKTGGKQKGGKGGKGGGGGIESFLPQKSIEKEEEVKLETSNSLASKEETKSGGKLETKKEEAKERGRENKRTIKISETVEKSVSLQPFVMIDRLNGLVVVRARPRTLKKVEEYIRSVSESINKQILVELEILEFTSSKLREMGINWDAVFHKVIGGDKYDIHVIQKFTSLSPGVDFESAQTPSFQVSVVKRNGDFSAVIQALSQYGSVRVLSTPRIMTLNNQPAVIRFGKDRIIIYTEAQNQLQTYGQVPQQTQLSSVKIKKTHIVSEGFTLFVLPRYDFSSNSTVVNIIPVIQNLPNTLEKTIDYQLANMVIADPTRFETHPVPLTIETRQLSAIAKLKENEIIILGGLAKESTTAQKEGVPFFENVPLLGSITSHKKKEKALSMFLILMKVRVF
jgi:type II secretory pathway component GspD/PulD (secretin)